MTNVVVVWLSCLGIGSIASVYRNLGSSFPVSLFHMRCILSRGTISNLCAGSEVWSSPCKVYSLSNSTIYNFWFFIPTANPTN